MNPTNYPQWVVDLSVDPVVILIGAFTSVGSMIVSLSIYRKLYRINAQILLRERSRAWRGTLEKFTGCLAPLLADQEAEKIEFVKF